MNKKLIVSILACAFSFLYIQTYATEETNKTSQSTQGDQSPAIFISPGGTSSVNYEVSQKKMDKMIQTATKLMREEFSNCLKIAAEFQTATLNELNVKLSKYLITQSQVSNIEAEEWARDILQTAPGIKKAQKEFEDTAKKYNEEISKMLVTSSYNYFAYVLGVVDTKLNALKKNDSEITVEINDRLVLFSDDEKRIEPYVMRKLNLRGGNFIQLVCFPGKISLGLVVKCPTIKFGEVKSNTLVQKFSFTPIHPTGSLSSGTKLPYKDSRIKHKDVMYPLTGQPSLDEKTKNEFEKTFDNFFQLAYGDR